MSLSTVKPPPEAASPAPKASGRAGWHGIDFHILMTLLFRGSSIVGGAVTVLLIPAFLDPVRQGYYYTFFSLLAVQVLFELGLSQVVVQLVGHEVAHLKIADRQLSGDALRVAKVASLIQLLRRWYAVAAVLFWLLGGAAGAFFFHHRGQLPPAEWAPIWIALVTATAVNLYFIPALSLMEGTGQVGQVARLRLAQSLVGYLLLWLLLALGCELWAVVAIPVVCVLATAAWLRREGTLYRWLTRHRFDRQHGMDWKRDMLPFQWRIAVSWICGYLVFSILTPIIFANQGAAEAGRFGMAITIFNAVSSVGMSWVNAKAPNFGMLISTGNRAELNALFDGVFRRSIAFTALACGVIVGVAKALTLAGLPFMSRLAGPDVLAALGLTCILNCIVFSVATYMRAHREEPMLPVSVVAGIATVMVAYAGSLHGVLWVAIGCLLLQLCIVLPWSLRLFSTYRRRTA